MANRLTRFALGGALLLVALGLGTGLLRASFVDHLERVGEGANSFWVRPLFDLGPLPVSPAFLFKAAAFLVLLSLLSRAVRRLLSRRLLVAMDEGQRYALARGAGYLVFFAGLIIGLQSAGLDLSSLAVFGGALGIGLGFGLQTLAKDFVSGLILLAERSVKVGDRIEVASLTGDIVRIGPRTTSVRTNDNVVIIVPNSELTERVTNWSAHGRRARFSVAVGVGYDSDPDRVREVLLAVAANCPDALADPAPDVILVGFGDSSIDFELRVWTETKLRTPQVLRSDLYFSLFRRLGEAGISIPFPQRDVHVRTVAAGTPQLTVGASSPASPGDGSATGSAR